MEGDQSGCTYTPTGQLLIGGLAIDGSTAAETGWATNPSASASTSKERQSSQEQTCNGKKYALSQITFQDILEGHTCRPISLNDLRIYLEAQRDTHEAEMPISSFLTTSSDPSLELKAPSTHTSTAGTASSDPNHLAAAAAGKTTSELNALDFVVAYRDYSRDYTARGSLRQSQSEAGPSSQRREFEEIVETYLDALPSRADSRHNSDGRLRRRRRMDWMIETGLLGENEINAAVQRSQHTDDPAILSSIVDTVSGHINTHIVPPFIESNSTNLSRNTSNGRLLIGTIGICLGILFSVLLCLRPSPLSPDHMAITRWYRILLFPLWVLGFGYWIAAFTKVCVWLSLRGHYEPLLQQSVSDLNDQGLTEAAEKRTTSAQDHSEESTHQLMAPEIWSLLSTLLPFLKKKDWNSRPARQCRTGECNPPRSMTSGLRRWTGFAVGTKRIGDEQIRKTHLKSAFKALVLDTVLSVVVTIVVVAIP
ncbi:unnamed protein product [Sympodiomycopsis kandeliae]